MPYPRIPYRAFTLIELMLAIALGMVIVYTAFAGFRVAAQSVTVANRLAMENALLRSGFLASHEDLDFWTTYDDPNDAGKQPLRPTTMAPWGMAEGLTFAPMDSTLVGGISGLGDGVAADSDRGWDSTYRWPVSDPRSWWRGNLGEQTSTDVRFGFYCLFTDVSATFNLANASMNYGNVTVANTWFDNQLQTLWYAIGHYGMLEYMPANTIYTWYQTYDPGGSTTQDGMSRELITVGTSFINNDGYVSYPRGNFLLTFGTSFILPSPSYSTDPTTLRNNARRFYETNYNSNTGLMGDFENKSFNAGALMSQRPAEWPEVTVSTAHFLKDARYVALSKIRCVSPLTGQLMEFTYAGFGTSLRGARQQRAHPTATNPAGGWANWDDAVGAVNDPTLDDHLP